jgi:hypothetical protein
MAINRYKIDPSDPVGDGTTRAGHLRAVHLSVHCSPDKSRGLVCVPAHPRKRLSERRVAGSCL